MAKNNLTPDVWDLAEQYHVLMEVDEEGFEQALAEMEAPIAEKLEAATKAVKLLETADAAFRAEAQRLQARARTMQNRVEHLKEFQRRVLEVAGLKSIKAGSFSLTRVASPWKVEIADQAALWPWFLTEKPAVWVADAGAVKEYALTRLLDVLCRCGETVRDIPGARVSRGEHLLIR